MQLVHFGQSCVLAEAAAARLLLDPGVYSSGFEEDYLRTVDPGLAVPIHQAILAKPEKFYELFRELAPVGTEVHVVPHGEAFKL